jgi:uncharacterized protein YhhL (DUF1145 family)
MLRGPLGISRTICTQFWIRVLLGLVSGFAWNVAVIHKIVVMVNFLTAKWLTAMSEALGEISKLSKDESLQSALSRVGATSSANL